MFSLIHVGLLQARWFLSTVPKHPGNANSKYAMVQTVFEATFYVLPSKAS